MVSDPDAVLALWNFWAGPGLSSVIEFSVVMEMLCIFAVQYGSHQLPEIIKHLKGG